MLRRAIVAKKIYDKVTESNTESNTSVKLSVSISIDRSTKISIIDNLLKKAEYKIIEILRDNIRSSFHDLVMDNALVKFLDEHPRIRNFLLDKAGQQVDQCVAQFCGEFNKKLLDHVTPVTHKTADIVVPKRAISTSRGLTAGSRDPIAEQDSSIPRSSRGTSDNVVDWIVNHDIIRFGSHDTKTEHINYLCNSSHSLMLKKQIQTQLTHPDKIKGRFINLVAIHCKDNPEIICKILDSFKFSKEEIKCLVDTPGLKNNVRAYLAGLPPSSDNLELLERCVDQSTMLGQFCWTSTRWITFFASDYLTTEKSPATTITHLRKIIPVMKSRLASLFEQSEILLRTNLGEAPVLVPPDTNQPPENIIETITEIATSATEHSEPNYALINNVLLAFFACLVAGCAAYLFSGSEDTSEHRVTGP